MFTVGESLNSTVPVLKCGRDNNFVTWKEDADVFCCARFGKLSSVILTDKAYEVPCVVETDFEDNLSEKVKGKLMEEAEKMRYKTKLDMQNNEPKFFGTLLAMMSPESLMEIKQHGDYGDANANKNPNKLWAIIKDTHYTSANMGGRTKMMLKMARIREFATMSQKPGESVATFKHKYDALKKVLGELGVARMNKDDEAMDFLVKLDSKRYGSLLESIHNDASRGTPYPKDVKAVYDMASTWTITHGDGVSSSGMQAVYMQSTEGKNAHTGNDRGPRPSKGQNGNWRSAQRQNRKANGEGTYAKSEQKEWRTCRGCLKPGHIWKNCPDKPKDADKVMLTSDTAEAGESREYESDEHDMYEAFMTTERCLFTDTEVLLDNQASKSVFKNAKLLHSMGDIDEYRLSGVNEDAECLRVRKGGRLGDLPCEVGHTDGAAANILSKARLLDGGARVEYRESTDDYVVHSPSTKYVFARKIAKGVRSSHYICDVNLVATVRENMNRYTKREVAKATQAKELMEKLGHATAQATADLLKGGVMNCGVTPQDVWNADAIFGKSAEGLKGKTKKMSPIVRKEVLAPQVTRVDQVLNIDIMFVKEIEFLVGVLVPLNYCMVSYIKGRGTASIGSTLRKFVSEAKGQGFRVTQVRCDGERGVQPMHAELREQGITLDIAGPGQHVPVVERMIQTLKGRVRAYDSSLPYVMPAAFLVACVSFCAGRINMQVSSSSTDMTTPWEQYLGRKVDAKIDLRVGFGEYVQAIKPSTDNTMNSRTEACIALLPTKNVNGSVWCYRLSTQSIVRRDQLFVLPMSDLIIRHINKLADLDKQSRGGHDRPKKSDMSEYRSDMAGELGMPELVVCRKGDKQGAPTDDENRENITGRKGDVMNVSRHIVQEEQAREETPEAEIGGNIRGHDVIARSEDPTRVREASGPIATYEEAVKGREAPRRGVNLDNDKYGGGEIDLEDLREEDTEDEVFVVKERHRVLTTSVRKALKERGEEAMPVIEAELRQIDEKGVMEGVHFKNLTEDERGRVIRSSMFLKDKYTASGVFEKYKARLVAGGNQQDKMLYEDLSSPTANTSSVLTIAAIAAAQGRDTMCMDVGGAYLNASMEPTGVKVHMRLDRTMTGVLVEINPKYKRFVDNNGTLVVLLKKALYGCVEASRLWYKHLTGNLKSFGFVENGYDPCVLNKEEKGGSQTSIVLHVDDILGTGKIENLRALKKYLESVYDKISSGEGKLLDYVGMSFDFRERGKVRVTMQNCEEDIVKNAGECNVKRTPATEDLFTLGEEANATEEERKWFHSNVAKMLYLAKRVRPECLVAVSYLSTRVQKCNKRDLRKLKRLIGYIAGTPGRGILLEIGDKIRVCTQIDAAYGVHEDSGKSHTGCLVTVGIGGPVYVRSVKQRIVSKSSTEAELIGLSDCVSHGISLKNFLREQGHETGPLVVQQDNMSCIALVKRGRPGSDASRHICIRYFWIKERVDLGLVNVVHRESKRMWANMLTKPVTGKQFVDERQGLTNWEFPLPQSN